VRDPAKIGAGLGCFANVPFWIAVERAHTLGFQSIELLSVEGSRHSVGLLPGIWFDEMSAEGLERLGVALAPFTHTSVHAPFVDAPLFTYNRRIAQEALRQVKACIAVAGRLGMRAVAVHANRRGQLDARDYWDDMVHVCRELGDTATEAGTVVALETGYPDRYQQFLDLVRQVDHPAVGACVDIGHVAFLQESGPRGTDDGVANYNRNLIELCRELGPRLVHMHLHDVRKVDWRDHRQLGSGVIDLPALARALSEIDYDGLMQFELEEPHQEPALLASRAALEVAIADIGRPGTGEQQGA
jgi:sugar phosphate isomerase/epimerase